MSTWAEFEISIVYYSGLFLTGLAAIGTLMYLRPGKLTLSRITGSMGAMWRNHVVISLLMAALLGAMSVSFKNCDGDLPIGDHPLVIVQFGLTQISRGLFSIFLISSVWFVILICLRMTTVRKLDRGLVFKWFALLTSIAVLYPLYLLVNLVFSWQ